MCLFGQLTLSVLAEHT